MIKCVNKLCNFNFENNTYNTVSVYVATTDDISKILPESATSLTFVRDLQEDKIYCCQQDGNLVETDVSIWQALIQ